MVRRTSITFALASAAVVASVSGFCQAPSGAQLPRQSLTGQVFWGLKPDDRSNVALLAAPALQRELELTSSQEGRIREFYRGRDEDRRKLNQERTAARRGGNEKLADRITEELRERDQGSQEELKTLLTPAQNRRLGEVALQLEGVFAIVKPDVAEKLGLDDLQMEAAQRIVALSKARDEEIRLEASAHDHEVQAQIGMRGAELHELKQGGTPASRRVHDRVERISKAEFAALGPFHKQVRKRLDAEHRAAEKDLLRILTKKQKSAYSSLCGKPFDLESLKQPAYSPPRS